jgi:hypothetical protein
MIAIVLLGAEILLTSFTTSAQQFWHQFFFLFPSYGELPYDFKKIGHDKTYQ